jgi:hypothetical protein
MDPDQAAEIFNYLLTAAYELDEARAAIAVLVEDNKESDLDPLGEAVHELNCTLLKLMSDRFPDLIPFEEFPAISSTLRWEQVRLPTTVSEAEVDRIIFSIVVRQWRKMALIVLVAGQECGKIGLAISHEVLAARVQALVEAGRLENQGDLRRWRHSEVRLKTEVAPSGPIH